MVLQVIDEVRQVFDLDDRCLLAFPGPGLMPLWGAMIATIVVVAMPPWFLGLLVAAPVLGHASWHASDPQGRPCRDRHANAQ